MSLQKAWRERARELESQVAVLLQSPDIDKAQVTLTHALVMREMLPAFADLLDVLEGSNYRNQMTTLLRRMSDRNNAIREAAANGDWDEFTDLVTGNGKKPGSPVAEGVAT